MTLEENIKAIREIGKNPTNRISKMKKRIAELEQKLEQTEKDLTDYQFNYPKILDLEKENERLRTRCEQARDEGTGYMQQLEQENATLKKQLEALSGDIPWNKLKDVSEVTKELTEAKDLLKKVVGSFYYLCEINNFSTNYECLAEAEQFLKEE